MTAACAARPPLYGAASPYRTKLVTVSIEGQHRTFFKGDLFLSATGASSASSQVSDEITCRPPRESFSTIDTFITLWISSLPYASDHIHLDLRSPAIIRSADFDATCDGLWRHQEIGEMDLTLPPGSRATRTIHGYTVRVRRKY